jgi:hypothetical protein
LRPTSHQLSPFIESRGIYRQQFGAVTSMQQEHGPWPDLDAKTYSTREGIVFQIERFYSSEIFE